MLVGLGSVEFVLCLEQGGRVATSASVAVHVRVRHEQAVTVCRVVKVEARGTSCARWWVWRADLCARGCMVVACG